MKRILNFRSSTEHYLSDACVVWCFDARFTDLLDELLVAKHWRNIDLIKVAGGAKALSSPENAEERNFILGQIAKSITLHKAARVALMVHAECGAYSKHFDDPKEERLFYESEAKKAGDIIRAFLAKGNLSIEIISLVADFDGLWQA